MSKHRDAKRCRAVIVSESVFSMDGDLAPLAELESLARKYDCYLLIDEAHALGVFGPGLSRGLPRDKLIVTATLGKALGSFGGIVACSDEIAEVLVNKARPFIYSTALPPASVGGALQAVNLISTAQVTGEELLEIASWFRKELRERGYQTGESNSQIVPVIIGDTGKTVGLSQKLLNEGFLAYPMRPPTVSVGTARIRFSLQRLHSSEQLESLLNLLPNV